MFTPPPPITAAANVGISVQTLGPFTGTQRRLVGENRRLWLFLSLPLAGMVLAGFACRLGTRQFGAVGFCLTLLASVTLLSCGGGRGSAPPPPPPISVSVSPSVVSTLYPNVTGAPAQTQQFTATVHNSIDQGAIWTVSGGGVIDKSSGLYTAPEAVPTGAVTVTAAAHADPSKSGNATVNIQTPTAPGTFVITVTVTEATQPIAQHSATFNLTVQ